MSAGLKIGSCAKAGVGTPGRALGPRASAGPGPSGSAPRPFHRMRACVQWGASTACGQTLPCRPQALSGSSPVPVTVRLSYAKPTTRARRPLAAPIG
jgi:hypothetical protein